MAQGKILLEMHKLFESHYNETERIGKLKEKAIAKMKESLDKSILKE